MELLIDPSLMRPVMAEAPAGLKDLGSKILQPGKATKRPALPQ